VSRGANPRFHATKKGGSTAIYERKVFLRKAKREVNCYLGRKGEFDHYRSVGRANLTKQYLKVD